MSSILRHLRKLAALLGLLCLGSGSLYAQLAITTSPVSATKMQGDTNMFFVRGTYYTTNWGIPTCQWYFNSNPIPAVTATNLLLTGLDFANAGYYHVVVTKGTFSATSSVALLTIVSGAPGITNSPPSVARIQGDNHTFTVLGTNFSRANWPSTFRWYCNDTLVYTGNTNFFTLFNIGWTNVGSYQVVVSNAFGSSTSALANLTVSPASAVFFDFNTPGQFSNNFNARGGQNASDTTAVYPTGAAVWGEAGSQGVTNSGSVAAYATTNTSTLIHWRQPFNYSGTGAVLNASVMFKYRTPTGPAANDRQIMYLGFISATNADPKTAISATNAAFAVPNPGPAYIAARLNMLTNSPSTNAELTFEFKELGLNTRKANIVGALTNGQWYKLSMTMTNGRTGTTKSNLVSATLEAMGPEGLDAPTTILKYNTNLNASLETFCTNSRMYLALSPVDYYGIERFDNLAGWMQDGPVGFTTPPLDQTALQNRSFTFTAGVRGTPPFYYQWMKGGTDIPGATKPSYTVAQAATTDEGSYSVRVYNDGGSETSASALLTVTPDSQPPALLSAGSLDGKHVGVRFNEAVSATTAQVAGNYVINGSIGVVSATLRPNGQEVDLVPASPIAGSFTVSVSGVQDLAGNPMTATDASGTALNLTAFDVGGADGMLPMTAGSSFSSQDGEISMLAGGLDFGGTADDGHLLLRPQSGDFDLKVQVQSLTRATLWNPVTGGDELARAGLVARAGTNANSRSVQLVVQPWDFGLPAGLNRCELGYRYDTAQTMTNVAPNGAASSNAVTYPQTWLRMRRVNSTVSSYRSTDGVTWSAFTSMIDPALPENMLIGLGASAHMNPEAPYKPVGVEFSNFGDVGFPAAVINSVELKPATINIKVPNSYTMTTIVSVANISMREVQYVWQRTNSTAGGWTNIPSALSTSSNYVSDYFTGNDERDYSSWAFRCIVKVSGQSAVTSGVSTVIGYTDTNAPKIYLAECPVGSASNIMVYIDKTTTMDTLMDINNYVVTNLTGVVTPIIGISLLNNGPTNAAVMLTMGTALVGNYKIGGMGFVDFAYPPNTNMGTTARSFSGAGAVSPFFVEGYWNLATGGDPVRWDPGMLTNHAKYLNHTYDTFSYAATATISVPSDAHVDDGNKGMCYFVPPTTGNYKFWIRGDDGFMLRMNTNGADPLGAVTIAYRQNWVNANYEAGWNSAAPRPGTGTQGGIGGPISLEAGKPYWLEVIQKNGGGGDEAYVTFRNYTDAAVPTDVMGAPNIQAPVGPAYVANVTPSTLTIQEGGYARFTASGIGGSLPYYARWFKGGVHVDAASNQYSAMIGPFGCADTNVTFVVSNFWSVGKFVVPVNVVMDSSVPVALTAYGNGLNHFYVSCNTRMDPATVANTNNYTIPGVTVLGAAVYQGTNISIRTTPQLQGVTYSIGMQGLKSGNCISLPMEPATVMANTLVVSPGILTREFYTDLAGATLSELTNAPKYINHTPDLVDSTDVAMTPDSFAENFGATLSGYFVPQVSGNYSFFMAHDDAAELILSTDDGMEGSKQLLVAPCCHAAPDRGFVSTVNLAGGRYYYFQAKVKDGGGADALRIYVRTPLESQSIVATNVIPTYFLATSGDPASVTVPQIGITKNPTNTVAIENQNAAFYATATNTGNWAIGYFWQRYDATGGVWTNVPGALGPVFEPYVTWADEGAAFRVGATVPGRVVYSASATVHILPDEVCPTLVAATGSALPNSLIVTFSEAVEPASATNTANYVFSGGVNIANATLATKSMVILRTVGNIPSGFYTLTVSNVRDIAHVPNAICGGSATSAPFTAPWLTPGPNITLDVWSDINPTYDPNNATPGNTITYWGFDVMTNQPTYPYTPDFTTNLTSSDWPQTSYPTNWENYGARITGVIIPPVSGPYSFYVDADDSAKLSIGPGGSPIMTKLMVNAEGSCAACASAASYSASSVDLIAGVPYNFEVLFIEGTGGDYVHMRWMVPGSSTFSTIFSNNLWGFAVNPDVVQLPFTIQPTNTDLLEGRNATFYAQASSGGVAPESYQWQRYNATTESWEDMAGEISGILNLGYVCEDVTGARYRVRSGMSAYGGIITRTNISDEVTLTVGPDTEPPYIVSVGSLDGTLVGVVFNEPVRVDTDFTYYWNWDIRDTNVEANFFDIYESETGLNKQSILVLPWPDTNAIYSDKVVVFLPTSVDWSSYAIASGGWEMPFLHGPFTVTCEAARDIACRVDPFAGVPGNGNAFISASSTVMGLTHVEIGVPQPLGYAFVGDANRIHVGAGGRDMWEYGDEVTFLEKPVTGDFDVRVTVVNFPDPAATPPNTWSKAAIMVRGAILGTDGTYTNSTLGRATNSLMAYVTATATNGQSVFSSAIRYQDNTPAADFPGGTAAYRHLYEYPAQIRMVREGDTITTFSWSYLTNVVTDTNTMIKTTNILGPLWATNATAQTTNWPSEMFLGLAVTSHSQSNRVQATFENFKLIDGPTIVTQPEGTTKLEGLEIALSVAATGPEDGNPIRYQWRKNGVAIAGANSSTLLLTNTTAAASGGYSVEVRNSAGAVLSTVAQVLVLGVPVIVQQPANQPADCFGSATFAVVANTNPDDPMTYQWKLNGADILGANSATLTVDNLTAEKAGPYSVAVINSLGSTLSSNAWAVLSDPTQTPMIYCPENMTVECGSPAIFAATATNSCGAVVAVACTPPSGQVLPVGANTVNCTTVNPVGPTANCSFVVTVADTLPPVISGCSTNITTTNTVVTWTLPTATDACQGAVPVVCTPPSGSTFSPWTVTPVLCEASDSGNRTASCSFTVAVQGTVRPNLTITPQENGVVVSWPVEAADYGLFYATSLGTSRNCLFTWAAGSGWCQGENTAPNWQAYQGALTTNGNTISASITITNNTMFFGLMKP